MANTFTREIGSRYSALSETDKWNYMERLDDIVERMLQNPRYPFSSIWLSRLCDLASKNSEINYDNDSLQRRIIELFFDALSKNQCRDPEKCAQILKGSTGHCHNQPY